MRPAAPARVRPTHMHAYAAALTPPPSDVAVRLTGRGGRRDCCCCCVGVAGPSDAGGCPAPSARCCGCGCGGGAAAPGLAAATPAPGCCSSWPWCFSASITRCSSGLLLRRALFSAAAACSAAAAASASAGVSVGSLGSLSEQPPREPWRDRASRTPRRRCRPARRRRRGRTGRRAARGLRRTRGGSATVPAWGAKRSSSRSGVGSGPQRGLGGQRRHHCLPALHVAAHQLPRILKQGQSARWPSTSAASMSA